MTKFTARNPNRLLINAAFLATDITRLYHTTFDRKMMLQGLNRSEWWLISVLCYCEGHTQQELREVMDIGAPGLTKMVDRLEKKGLVRRSVDTRDRRVRRIKLTKLSRPLAGVITREADQMMEKSLVILTPTEQVMLIKLLKKWRLHLLTMED